MESETLLPGAHAPGPVHVERLARLEWDASLHAKAQASQQRNTAGVGSNNVDLVRRWVQPLGTTFEEVQAAVEEFCEPDVDYYPVAKWPEARPCHGREEFSQFLTGFREAWLRYEWAIDDLIPVWGDRVLACINLRAEGRESGMNLEGNLYQCIWLRHGLFFRIEDHLTLSGALHALGFEGETLEAAGLRTR